MIKEVSIQVSVRFSNIGDKVIQRFTILGSKRNYRYLLDGKFYISKIFKNQILERSLPTRSNNYIFEKKKEEENCVEIISVAQEGVLDNDLLIDYYFTIHDFVPTSFGCEYCISNKEDFDENIKCEYYGKIVKRRKGSCKYFDQRRLFKT
ncbi:MAG: hypothetical protein ACW98D_20600 [Promethearchaeota archaeon]|jgi:hypothetical protein